MYQAGARPVFDALDAHPYGFAYPPDDPPGAHDGFNMNRMLDLRATMKVYGDGSKSVWSTEVGWTTHGVGEHAWLTVTPEEQADYLVRTWRKTREEYPWLKGFTVGSQPAFRCHVACSGRDTMNSRYRLATSLPNFRAWDSTGMVFYSEASSWNALHLKLALPMPVIVGAREEMIKTRSLLHPDVFATCLTRTWR